MATPTDVKSLNVGWDPSPLAANDAFDANSLIERSQEVKVDVNDYSRFKDIGADLEDDDKKEDTKAKVAPTPTDPSCRNCSKAGAKLKCSVCKKAVYCARKCQASDWQFHKRICKKPEPPKKNDPPRPSPSKKSTTEAAKTTKTTTTSAKPKAASSESSVVVTDEADLPKDMRGYKNGMPYFHRELSKEEKNLIGDIAPQKIETKPVATSSAGHDGSAWNTAGTFEERVFTKWAEEQWNTVFTGATLSEGNLLATLKAPEKITGDASICVVRGKKRYLFDFNFNLPFEVAISGGSTCKGSYTMNDISNDEDYEISWRLTKKPSSSSEQSAVQAFVGTKNSGLQKELVRLISVFAQEFLKQ
ncbi:hypothetical protein PHYBOEH_007717 [Phytophthora boehmeriae]|uniref:MYND-type domain-containing protein n=1 Tax=Phytophthora boehmeriae TaxID=109152 RepID=A0A8T1X2B0_9STRA|nr:hypothetical protein PHYBOEH_007717 [Phytophthora boehmeriae]